MPTDVLIHTEHPQKHRAVCCERTHPFCNLRQPAILWPKMSENFQGDHAKIERAKNQAALAKLLYWQNAEIEAEINEDHSIAALAEASQALKRIRRLVVLLDDSSAVDEINARGDALEATLNMLKLKSSTAAHVSAQLALV
jgi:hypothetical protein